MTELIKKKYAELKVGEQGSINSINTHHPGFRRIFDAEVYAAMCMESQGLIKIVQTYDERENKTYPTMLSIKKLK